MQTIEMQKTSSDSSKIQIAANRIDFKEMLKTSRSSQDLQKTPTLKNTSNANDILNVWTRPNTYSQGSINETCETSDTFEGSPQDAPKSQSETC
jgi:hypothetical protein